MVPGIDFSGVVSASQSPRFRVGDRVALTGWGVGEGWSGGFAERARVKSEWLVKLPETISGSVKNLGQPACPWRADWLG